MWILNHQKTRDVPTLPFLWQYYSEQQSHLAPVSVHVLSIKTNYCLKFMNNVTDPRQQIQHISLASSESGMASESIRCAKIISGNNGTKILALLSWLKIQPWGVLAASCDQVCETTLKKLSEERVMFASLGPFLSHVFSCCSVTSAHTDPLVFKPVWVDSMSTVIIAPLIHDSPDSSFLT